MFKGTSRAKRQLFITALLGALGLNTGFAFEPVATPVTTARATTVSRASFVTVSGPVVPWEEMSVTAEVAGLPIKETYFEVGEYVQRGAVLARLDDRSVYPEVYAAEAGLDAAHARAQEALTNRDRAVALEHTGALSQQMILQARTRAEEARAQEDAARAALAAAQIKLAHTEIRAPDAGVITERAAVLGTLVNLGQPLFRLIRQGRLEWHPQVPAPQFAAISAHAAVQVELGEHLQVSGHVRTVAPAIDPNTQRGTVWAQLDSNPALHAGLYLKGRISLPERTVILVPSESVVVREGTCWVVTLLEQRAHLVRVSVGDRDSSHSEILSGLTEGTPVIVRGAGFLAEGSPVRVVTDGPAVGRN